MEEIKIHAKAHIGNDLADVLKQFLESQEFRERRIVDIVSRRSSQISLLDR